MFKLGALAGAPIGGFLTKNYTFLTASTAAGAFHLLLVPLFALLMPEKPNARQDLSVWIETKRQGLTLLHSPVLLAAAGMVFLIAIAPGLQASLGAEHRFDRAVPFLEARAGWITSPGLPILTGPLRTLTLFAGVRLEMR